jgi:methyl-accepting chemotaxis protein
MVGPLALARGLRMQGRTTPLIVAATLVTAAVMTAGALLALDQFGAPGADPATLATARAVIVVLGTLAGTMAAGALALLARRNAGMRSDLARLSSAASSAAAGATDIDLGSHAGGTLAPLAAGLGALVTRVRALTEGLTRAAGETTMMSSEITAGAEEMAAAAGEIASTAADLSNRATEMASAIHGLSGSADELSMLSAELFRGARQSVERNMELRIRSGESRAQLDRSVASLEALANEAAASVGAVETLASESEEVRGFIVLVRKLARQSKLLALNAAMEAARAGQQGEGFAVVAGEVRRLATMSSEGAERTAEIVDRVLARVEQTRGWSVRTEQAVVGLRGVVTASAASFTEIESAIGEFDTLAGSIERTAASLDEVATRINEQLLSISQGTEGFAASMEQVAASSEQQSASTEEIAAAAVTLHSTAERLSGLIGAARGNVQTREA